MSQVVFKKVIVIDARGHLLGRLASYVAKQLLSGIFIPLSRAKNCGRQDWRHQHHWIFVQKQDQIRWVFEEKTPYKPSKDLCSL